MIRGVSKSRFVFLRDTLVPVAINLRGSKGNDNLKGSDDPDTLIGLDGDDTLSGGASGDLLHGDHLPLRGSKTATTGMTWCWPGREMIPFMAVVGMIRFGWKMAMITPTAGPAMT
jgi:Ca2+-binding RTX toxin-like protein